MKNEIYQWMKNLAVFYIVFTAVLHLIPDSKYERYVRSFMGLLLIFMLCTPVFSLLGKGEQWKESFGGHYQEEAAALKEEELKNLQELYLQKGYEYEIKEKIMETLQNIGIMPYDTAVHIEGERVAAIIYLKEELTAEQERRMEDELWSACGIRKKEYQIQITEHDAAAVAGGTASGIAAGSDGSAGI